MGRNGEGDGGPISVRKKGGEQRRGYDQSSVLAVSFRVHYKYIGRSERVRRNGQANNHTGGGLEPGEAYLRIAWSVCRDTCDEPEGTGFAQVSEGIEKLKGLLEGQPSTSQFNAQEYMNLYTFAPSIDVASMPLLCILAIGIAHWHHLPRLCRTIYNMCTQKPPHDFSQSLYDRYNSTFEHYLQHSVMPSLRQKHGEPMLKDLVKRWENHKVMVRWLSRFFNYLDRYYIQRQSLTPLYQVGMVCFRGSLNPTS